MTPLAPGLYPFTSHYLDLGGHRLHYLDEGSGEAVLMLHGNPTWSFYFRDLIKSLKPSHRVIAPDHIGCGLSDKPPLGKYDYTLEQRVRDIETLVDHLQLPEKFTLVLHDWGGMIGMAFAHRHPERIKRLVLLNTGAFLLPEGKRLPWSLRLCRMPWVGDWLVRGLNLFCLGAAKHCVTRRPLPPEVRAGYLAPYDSWRNRVAVLRFVQDIPVRPGDRAYALVREVQDNLAQFQNVPTLICWGDRDFVFDQHFLETWKKHLPQAEIHRFADAGHYVLEDAGAEIITLIQEFIDRLSV